MSELKDWRGTKIEVGDVILYAVKHSTSVEVNEAIVSEVGMKPKYSWSPEDKQIPYITAEWQKSTDGDWAQKWRKIRTVTITNVKAVTVVAKHMPDAFSVPAEPEVVEWKAGTNG